MSQGQPEADRKLDVREIDGEPFGDIMAALESLSDDESLLLVNSFEPEPLYQVIEGKGFMHETMNPGADLWYVKIEHA